MSLHNLADVSAQLSAMSPGASLEHHTCQLNQSRWDVMSSPPSTPEPPPSPPLPPQVDEVRVPAENRRFVHLIAAVERELEIMQEIEDSDKAVAVDKADLNPVKNLAHISTTTKPVVPEPRSRPKRATTSSSKSYDLVYYEGFCPSWGENLEHESKLDPLLLSSMVDEDLGCEDQKKKKNMKKRARKRIKARSSNH